MSKAFQHDVGAFVKAESALKSTNLTDLSTSVTFTGVAIDRQALGRHYNSCKAVVAACYTGAATSSAAGYATITLNFQDSPDGSTFANYSTATVPSTVTIGSTASTGAAGAVYGEIEQDVDLAGADRYVRITTVGTLAGTSSANALSLHGILIFGGADELPAA
jgi:hypothetical protein